MTSKKKTTRKKAIRTKFEINNEITELQNKITDLQKELPNAITVPDKIVDEFKKLIKMGYEPFLAVVDGNTFMFNICSFWIDGTSNTKTIIDEFEFDFKKSSKVFQILDNECLSDGFCNDPELFLQFVLKYSKSFKQWYDRLNKVSDIIIYEYGGDVDDYID
jgi:hypothetical protein